MKKLVIYIILIVIGTGSFLAKPVFSQTQATNLDLTVNPPVLDFTVKPGDKIQDKFRIRNNLRTSVDLSIKPKKLISSVKTGLPIPAEPAPEDSFISWVKFDQPNFTALPQEWKDVNFTITVPKDAAFGYYYVFEITPHQNASLSGVGAKVNGKVLIVVLLNVQKAGAKMTGKLINFKTDKFVNEYLPVNFTADVANTGNVHIRPRGNIFIRSIGQNDVAILEVNAHLGAIIPQGKRTFTGSWDDGFLVQTPVTQDGKVKLDRKGNPITKLTANWNKLTDFRLGRYTASLLLVYDNGKRDETLQAQTEFWVVPYTLITIILISLLAAFIIIRLFIKWYIRRELARQRGSKNS